MINVLINRRYHFWAFSLLILSLGNGWYFSAFGLNANYLILLLFLLVIMPTYTIFSDGLKLKLHKPNKLMWLLLAVIFTTFIYGVFLGIANQYKLDNVIRNGFSLLFYFSFLVVFWSRPTLKDIVALFKVSAILVLLLTIVVYLSVIGLLDYSIAKYVSSVTYGIIGGGEFNLPRAFISNQLVLFPFFSLLLFSPKLINKIAFVGLSLMLLLLTITRAYILVLGFLLLIYLVIESVKKPLSLVLTVALSSGILAIIAVSNQNLASIINMVLGSVVDFSGDSISNSFRVEQMRWFIKYISDNPIFGYGFGFSMPEYQSDSVKTYAYELIYVDLWAKLGIIAFPLIAIYFAPLVLAFYKWKLQDVRLHLIVGVTVGNFASIGNPFLLSQVNILLIVISYYLLTLSHATDKAIKTL